MNNSPQYRLLPVERKRSLGAAAAHYFKGDGKSFALLVLRPFLGFLTAIGILDDASVIGVADDVLTGPMLVWIVFQIIRRRDARKYP